MTDVLDANGLTTSTLSELLAALVAGYQAIYGADINVASNSPDGQTINIYAQAGIDIRELATEVYNSFNPDRAIGTVLDERVAINNIARQGGTYTIQPIDITVSQTVTLQGLDGNFNSATGTGFTVQDDAGNQFILVDTTTLTAGTYSLNFRAGLIGQVETTVATITNAVTVVIGVTGINNSSSALTIGQNEETDAELRIRRQKSVALASSGYLNGLLGTILNITGVNSAVLFENVTNSVNADGVPAHGIWLIVEGGANTDIGNVIYNKKSYGANMKGSVEVDITTASGGTFAALFDRPTPANLYIKFNIQQTTGTTFDTVNIPIYMQNNLIYNINQAANTADITAIAAAAITATGGGGTPTDVKISADGVTWVDYLPTATKNLQWTVSPSNIAITIL
jgi:hypothetical protein